MLSPFWLTGGSSPAPKLYVTVTSMAPVPVLPWASVAEQSTLVWPGAKVAPDVGAQCTGTVPSTMSVAVAVHHAGAPDALSAVTDTLPGRLRLGLVLSVTVTVNEFDTVLP